MTHSEHLGAPVAVDDARPVLIRVHPGLCKGWGQYHQFAGAVYTLDAEGKVDFHVLQVPAELAEVARMGASVCPEGAISYLGPATEQSR